MELSKFFGFFLLVIVSADIASAWDQDDLDIFDLVEEINENFYTVLDVQQVIEYFHWNGKCFHFSIGFFHCLFAHAHINFTFLVECYIRGNP